jgi:hypothetical protein
MLGNVRVHRLDFVLAISDLSGGFNLQNGFTSLCEKFLFALCRAFVRAQFTIENHRQNSADCTYIMLHTAFPPNDSF